MDEPTLRAAAELPPPTHSALGYLLPYNVTFIVPLLAILGMTCFGVRSETLANMPRKRPALAKFGMPGLFAGLGVLVIAIL